MDTRTPLHAGVNSRAGYVQGVVKGACAADAAPTDVFGPSVKGVKGLSYLPAYLERIV